MQETTEMVEMIIVISATVRPADTLDASHYMSVVWTVMQIIAVLGISKLYMRG